MMEKTTACNRFTMKRGGDGAIAGAREGGLESAPARDLSGCDAHPRLGAEAQQFRNGVFSEP